MDFPFPIMLLVTLVASLGFALFFNVNKRRIIPATLGGVFTWAIYYVLSLYIEGVFIPVVIASIFAAVFAETMSRITHTPVTGFFIISVIPLIPGRALYYTMYYAFRKDIEVSFSHASEAIITSLGIAVGLLISMTLWGIWRQARNRHKKSV